MHISPVKWLETYLFLIALTFIRSFVRMLNSILLSEMNHVSGFCNILLSYWSKHRYTVVVKEFRFVLLCFFCIMKRLDLMFLANPVLEPQIAWNSKFFVGLPRHRWSKFTAPPDPIAMGLFLRKNHFSRCWGWLSLLNWIGDLTLSLLLNLPPGK